MTAEGSRRQVWISTFCRRTSDGILRAMFVVDEREFDSPEQAQATADDALMEINRRRIAGEVETRPVRPGEPPSGLPRWPEYKRRLDASDTAEQP